MKYKVTYYFHYLVVVSMALVLIGQWLVMHEMEKNYIDLNDKYASEISEKFDLMNETESLSNEIVRLQETIIELEQELEKQPQ